jgi:hypothetical protein
LLGFAVVVLSGPILALLFFASVGLAVYLLFKLIFRGKDSTVRVLSRMAAGTRSGCYAIAHGTAHTLKRGIESFTRRAEGDPARLRPVYYQSARTRYLGLGRIILESLSGAAVGALLGGALSVYIGQPPGETKQVIGIGAVIGTAAGLVLCVFRREKPASGPVENV